jgi:hypothetical protein
MTFRRYGDSPAEQRQMVADVIRLSQARSLPLDDE